MKDPLAGYSVLGTLTDEERQHYYALLETEQPELKLIGLGDQNRRLYEAVETVLAYIQKDKQQIVPASNISPQKKLANQALDVTLDRFHVQRYPGSSKHTIQINFSVEHLVNLAESISNSALTKEDILYGYIVEAADGQAVPPTGAAIFRGLCIESELQMTIGTINLADRVEQRILEALQSDIMKKGLTLFSTVNPAFPMISNLVMGATRMFLSRNKNRAIQRVPVGLLINAADADPKLREGSYLLVQADTGWFNLEDYYWNSQRGWIEDKELHEELPFNYIIFSIKQSMK